MAKKVHKDHTEVSKSGSTKTPKGNSETMPGATHGAHAETMSQMQPGPINHPDDHPVHNVPLPTDPRWEEQLSAQIPGAY